MFKNILNSGWLHALFIAIIAYPVGNITQKFLVSQTNSNIFVFTFLFMLSASFAMLLIAGPGKFVMKTLKHPKTWLYSFLQIVVLILGLLAFRYISATEGSALCRIEAFFTILLSWLFLNQKINKFEIIGTLAILLGFYFILTQSEIPLISKIFVVFLICARSLSQSIQKIITETHKTNRQTDNFKDSLRVTGFIMSITTLVFLILLICIACLKQGNNIEALSPFPYFHDFADKTACIIGIGTGFFILSFSKYCEFYAGKTIGSKYLSAVLSIYIVFVFLGENFLASFNIMEKLVIKEEYFLALICMILGSIIIAISGFFKDLKFIKKGEKQDTLESLN